MAEGKTTESESRITVEKVLAGEDPAIPIYHVILEHDNGTWTETFGTQELLLAFFRGVKAASMMLGAYVPDPEIPIVDGGIVTSPFIRSTKPGGVA